MENLPSELLAHIAKFGGTRNYQEFEGSGWGTNSWKLRDLLTAQTLSYGQFFNVDAFTSANVLRLVRGCPKLIDLLWYLDCDKHVDSQNVEDLLALLKDRGKGNPDQYVEVDGRIL